MTNTNERERARPVEGLAETLIVHMDSFAACGPRAKFAPSPSTASWPDYSPVEQAAARLATRAALAYLVSHGWLTPEYFEARKAEEKAAESGRNVDVSA